MSKPAVTALHQALRKSFQSLENNHAVWKRELAECGPLLGNVGNLAEQLRALANVQVSSTPLRDFPELEERLRFKLLQATDSVLTKLHEKISSLQSVRDAVSNQVVALLQLYQQNSQHLDLPSLTERSPTSPSITDMLEWLQDAERFYRTQFLRRKVLLQLLRADDVSLLESLPKTWNSLESPGADEQITDALCRVSFFMESP